MPRAPSGSLLPRAPLPSSVAGGGAAARAPSAGGERGLRELPAPGVGGLGQREGRSKALVKCWREEQPVFLSPFWAALPLNWVWATSEPEWPFLSVSVKKSGREKKEKQSLFFKH